MGIDRFVWHIISARITTTYKSIHTTWVIVSPANHCGKIHIWMLPRVDLENPAELQLYSMPLRRGSLVESVLSTHERLLTDAHFWLMPCRSILCSLVIVFENPPSSRQTRDER
jgi:hypothetical protein